MSARHAGEPDPRLAARRFAGTRRSLSHAPVAAGYGLWLLLGEQKLGWMVFDAALWFAGLLDPSYIANLPPHP